MIFLQELPSGNLDLQSHSSSAREKGMYWTRLQYSRQTHTHTRTVTTLEPFAAGSGKSTANRWQVKKYTQPQKRAEAELVVRDRRWDSGEVGWARSGKVSNSKSVQKELEGSAGESCM